MLKVPSSVAVAENSLPVCVSLAVMLAPAILPSGPATVPTIRPADWANAAAAKTRSANTANVNFFIVDSLLDIGYFLGSCASIRAKNECPQVETGRKVLIKNWKVKTRYFVFAANNCKYHARYPTPHNLF